MICPCKSRIACAGDDNPFTGFNTDAADCCTRIGVQYGVGGQLPALGSNWVNSNCVAFADACDQDTADSLALSGYYHCVALNNRTPPAFDFVDPPDVPTPWDVDVFGNTPQTCSALCPDGLLFSFTVRADQFFALSQIEADNMAHSFACRQLAINQVCMGSLIPTECCLGQTYSAFISATGTFSPFVFTVVSGSIPTGMLLTAVSSTAVKLAGNPSMAGTFNFSLKATDSHGNFMVKAYTLNVISISTGALPNNFTFSLAGTLAAPATWSIVSGSLPAGLSMNSSGAISGTPTTAGSSAFTVQVGDGSITCQKAFTMQTQGGSTPIVCLALTGSIDMGHPPIISVASRDAANRFLVSEEPTVPELKFVNTQTQAVIATDPLVASLTFDQGCYASSVGKVYVVSSNNVRVYTIAGAFVINIVLTGQPLTNPFYSPVDDRVYVLTDANFPSFTLTTINPHTDTVVTNTNTGVGSAGLNAPSFWLPTNSIALNFSSTWDIRSLPGMALLGQINTAPGGNSGGFCFDTATGKIFVGVFQAVTFNAEVWEINSTTFLSEHVYDMPNTGGAITFLEFNPVTGAVIGTSGIGQLAVLDPVAHTVVCELENGDLGGSIAIDYVSGKVFKGRDDANTISIFS
jgi:hypothetical protein